MSFDVRDHFFHERLGVRVLCMVTPFSPAGLLLVPVFSKPPRWKNEALASPGAQEKALRVGWAEGLLCAIICCAATAILGTFSNFAHCFQLAPELGLGHFQRGHLV
jgi:hypothetical protein